jgi:septal ring factor EnvC (AmiA/AmiB activator)
VIVLTSEEFQNLVLKKLTSLEADITEIKTDITVIKEDMSHVKKKVDVIEEQTKTLTEFKTVVKEAGEKLYKKIV